MKITNDRLKNYIYNNTESKIRGRAHTLSVERIDFSEDYQSAKAKIYGRSYEINFYGLNNGIISSSCTCPFDRGAICKHEVAVAFEIDQYISVERNHISSKENTPIYSKTAAITLPFKKKEDLTKEYIDNYSNNNYNNYNDNRIYSMDSKMNYIFYKVYLYQENTIYNVEITRKENTLSLLCNCNALNKMLCPHQVVALKHFRDEFPRSFISKEEINKIKNKLLKEYGFSITDKSYTKYFSFDEEEYGVLRLIPKKKGILKLAAHTNIDDISKELLSEQKSIEDELPIIPKKSTRRQSKGVGYAFSFYSVTEHNIPVVATPLIGNLNKERTSLKTRIEEITPDNVLYSQIPKELEEEISCIKLVLQLNHERLAQIKNNKDYAREKHIYSYMKQLIPLLKDKIVLRLENYYSKINKNDIFPITLSSDSSELSFKVIEEPHFYNLKSYITIKGKTDALTDRNIGSNFLFTIDDGVTYYLNKSISYSKTLAFFNKNAEIRIPKSDFDSYNKEFITPLAKKYTVDFLHLKKKNKEIKYDDVKKQVYVSETENHIVLKPVLKYHDLYIDASNPSDFQETKNNTVLIYKRNPAFDNAFISDLKALHPDFDTQEADFFYLNHQDFIEDMWFLNAFEKLKEKQIEVFGLNSLTKMKYSPHKPSISMSVNSDMDWFDVNIDISFGETSVNLKDVKKAILKKDKYVQLSNGSIGILPEKWIEKYTHLFRTGEVKKDKIEVSKYQFSVIDSLYEQLDEETSLVQDYKKFKDKLQNFSSIEKVAKPRGIKAVLRDYQQEGLNWLSFLDEFGFGGCLADDMGLGKTLQVISFFKHLKDTKKTKIPHLVIVPTSLIFNWQEEVKKFCKTLKVLVLTGSGRQKNTKQFNKYHIILTTYGTILRDISYLKEYTFNYIVLDESQAIKNPNSQRFKSVRLLKSENKLVLTGTPIENNTFDLYAQMTFVNPGLLGSMAHFKKEFSLPIDKDKNAEVADELRQLINPFLLRRTKEQVAKELPSKTEQVLYCTMENEQQSLYNAYKNKYRNYLLKKIDDDGLGKSKMYVLEGLTKLRQICDSPQLLNDDQEYTSQSIKIKELVNHITEKTGEHKLLIFSQFVKMLHLIKKELEKAGILFEYLDGKTKNRQEKVDNFQNNTSIRVFLISLKAGGTGLNLTEADYVYLVDPWWNPAVESQAIDRCYRIGQDKQVFAYKMICKDTIEEKIIKHQMDKKQISSDIIQTDESFVKSLSKEHIMHLFE